MGISGLKINSKCSDFGACSVFEVESNHILLLLNARRFLLAGLKGEIGCDDFLILNIWVKNSAGDRHSDNVNYLLHIGRIIYSLDSR